MGDVIALAGLGTIGLLSILYIFLRNLNKRLRRFVLRFDKIADKFE